MHVLKNFLNTSECGCTARQRDGQGFSQTAGVLFKESAPITMSLRSKVRAGSTSPNTACQVVTHCATLLSAPRNTIQPQPLSYQSYIKSVALPLSCRQPARATLRVGKGAGLLADPQWARPIKKKGLKLGCDAAQTPRHGLHETSREAPSSAVCADVRSLCPCTGRALHIRVIPWCHRCTSDSGSFRDACLANPRGWTSTCAVRCAGNAELLHGDRYGLSVVETTRRSSQPGVGI